MVVFGLTEEAGEKLCDKISGVFEQINVKPHFEAVRVGKKSADKARPVKVLLGNSSTVLQILVKAKELRLSEHHKTVFISPDRSPEDRVAHKKLVDQLREKMRKDPEKRYYIRSGRICEGKV